MTKFTDLALDPKVLTAISDAGYETPTPIQAAAIPHALEGRDVLGIAQTGTGKTASFTLPMITRLAKGRARARMPRSLVLAPTRELAAQVAENFEVYSKYHKLTMALLIGGVSFKDQDALIDRGVDVLIATPGRLLDHFERGKLLLTGVQIMVVDEADRMLDMGFIPDIERIFKLTPFTRQTLFFSATMAPEITRITQEFLQNPERVEVARQATTSETIAQRVCVFQASHRSREAKEKRAMLRAIIAGEGDALTNGIIFCNRKSDVDIVSKSLKQHGLDAGAIHGDLDQKVRMRVLDGFRDGNLRLLVASDVAARGLDIPNVSHVFNFDVPIHSEDYVHRIGRTGRAGREGKAITLCLGFEEKYLDKIEDLVKKKIDRMEAPEIPRDGPRRGREEGDNRGSDNRGSRRGRSDSRSENKTDQRGEARSSAGAPDNRPRGRDDSQRSESSSGGSNRRSRGRGGRDRDDGKTPVGLGDHVPAFLTRPLEIPAKPKKSSKKEDALDPEAGSEATEESVATPDETDAETEKPEKKKTRAKKQEKAKKSTKDSASAKAKKSKTSKKSEEPVATEAAPETQEDPGAANSSDT
ncbi:MAG: DEAD/DEAH box helicase [Pseudomonadota bacterium]